MKKVIFGKQYKKDFKRFRNQPEKVKKLMEIIRMLECEIPLPKELNPHKLTGNYNGFMECHIGGDLLLIWIDKDVIKIYRFGSHSELFKNKKR